MSGNERQESSYEKQSLFSGKEENQPLVWGLSGHNKFSFCECIQVQIQGYLGKML